jgi:predicted DNA-binding ribbon-helix-helix protein
MSLAIELDDAVFTKLRETAEKDGLTPETWIEIKVRENSARDKNGLRSFLHVARSLRLNGPSDFSSNLDEYLYGGKDLDEELGFS